MIKIKKHIDSILLLFILFIYLFIVFHLRNLLSDYINVNKTNE
jgi:hypothetical protein